MILNRRVIEQIYVCYLDITLPVKYEDDDMPFDAPLRTGKVWQARIDLNEQRILNWPQGKTLEFDMKVRDGGVYVLLDADLKEVARREDYVPCELLSCYYADYVCFDIDATGKILNWKSDANLRDFEEREDG